MKQTSAASAVRHRSLENVTTHDASPPHRLGAASQGRDRWFVHGGQDHAPDHEHARSGIGCEDVAREAIGLLHDEADTRTSRGR